MNTMRTMLIAIQMQDDFAAILKDLNVVRDEAILASDDGRIDDLNMLARRDHQLCTELTHLSYPLGRSTPSC